MVILQVENLKKAFGGLQAVNNVSFTIEKGELSSIIGPNGAGKTTLFNLITGFLSPDSGKVLFKGESIFRMAHYKIVRKGIARSFQRTNIFPTLTVFENVRAAILFHQKKNFRFFTNAHALKEVNEATAQILESLNLMDKAHLTSNTLAHGDQKRLELGIALSVHPTLLLLDEPTQGMSPKETVETTGLIEHLVKERGLTLIFVEHDMSVVFGISDSIKVMHQGRVIFSGKPEEVKKNDEVQRIYLGEGKG